MLSFLKVAALKKDENSNLILIAHVKEACDSKCRIEYERGNFFI